MQKILGLALIIVGASSALLAGVTAVPEIDASTGASAIAILAGGILVLRARRKK
ncbi:MAG TPA: hypothetical protein VLM42_00695 [Bryobacteraceae bacterium]|nr:hypothetical protein [Bryobacteraceae bacterium]